MQRFCRRCGKGFAGKGCGRIWILGMLWNCARQPAFCNVLEKYEPHGELFFFLIAMKFRLFYCGDTQGMCLDWFALDGRRIRVKWHLVT